METLVGFELKDKDDGVFGCSWMNEIQDSLLLFGLI